MKKTLKTMFLLALIISNTFTYSFANEVTPSPLPSAQETEKPVKSNRVKTSESPAPVGTSKPAEEKKVDVSKETEEKEEKEKEENKEVKETPVGPEVLSEAAILVNSNTGKVLYEKQSHAKMYPASTTKIMTAYIALQKLDLSQEIAASSTAVAVESDSSKMGLLVGEILTAEQLLYALMVQSANDAANVLAEAVSGSIPDFVSLMNDTAQQLGMQNTQFANPHGYHDENHYTTAYDMAILAQEAMKNEKFCEIVGTTSYTFPPTNKCDEERKFTNRNRMINPRADLVYRYSYATGIKTGSTSAAGQCLVGSATRSGMSLISVVFKAPENQPERSFVDTKRMFEYAYSKYRIRTVQKGDELASTCMVKWAFGKRHLILKTNEDVKTLLPKENYVADLLTNEITIYDDIVAPIKEGDELGEIRYYYDNEQVAVGKLYATRNVRRSYVKQFFSYVLSFWFLAPLGIVVAMILFKRYKEKKRIAKLRRIKKQTHSKKR